MAMASTPTTINSTTLENLVKCGICLDYYTDPRFLPCSHTFCYQCIIDLCKEGYAQCPMRDTMIIYRHGISQLPVNRIAKDLVECIKKCSQLKSSSSETKCSHCKQIFSEFICKTCSKSYCTICLKLEHDIEKFKTHSINIIINENGNAFCLEHNEEKAKYYCTLCEQIVCSDCLLFTHKDHAFITLQDIAQKTINQFHLSIEQLNLMKENLEKLNNKTTQAYQSHYQTHVKTKTYIEQTITDLQNLLEERKRQLISTLTNKDVEQQKIIREQKSYVEEHLKIILIRELFLKQILNIQDPVQLVKMKDDLINYNQLIQQQYEQLIQGSIYDLQHFTPDQNLLQIKQQLQDFGILSTETFSTDINHIKPLLTLSQVEGEEKYLQLQDNYAYGYRFYLTTPIQINGVRIKGALFDQDLTVYVLDHNDILIEKQMIKTNERTLKWITIPINCRIENNSYIFVWIQVNEENIPLIAYKDSNHNLRKINQNISVRSKRALMNKSINVNINSKFNVLYDALLNNDQENETIIPAIEMIIHI